MTASGTGTVALILSIVGIIWCVYGDALIQRLQIKKAAKRKTAFEAAAIRQACEDYDRLAAERVREKQAKFAVEQEVALRKALAVPAAPTLPPLEDGARWLDIE